MMTEKEVASQLVKLAKELTSVSERELDKLVRDAYKDFQQRRYQKAGDGFAKVWSIVRKAPGNFGISSADMKQINDTSMRLYSIPNLIESVEDDIFDSVQVLEEAGLGQWRGRW